MSILKKILVPKIYLPFIYIIIAVIINIILRKTIDQLFKNHEKKIKKDSFQYKRVKTFKLLFKNIIKYLIIIFTILSILTVYGIDVTSILAGLGIVGLVLTFALQDLAKDFIAGFSIILENQYAVGDTIEVNGFKGEVIYLGIKTTKIRNLEGQVKIISNHNITEVINYSMEYSLAIVDVDVSYEDDNDKVEKVLNDLAIELSNTLKNLKGDVLLQGINNLASSGVTYRMVAYCKPMFHLENERIMRKLIKQRLEKEKIKIPYPQVEVHNGK